ncbi:MAG TPA: LEA type 2 family protein [Polyangiaceae bacterium]|nr:LEA type 2 family protein [Polyangiaceae bacterium]
MERRASLFLIAAILLAGCEKPKPPELTPRSAQVSAIRPESVELALVIDAHNPNAFPIVANRVSATFELQDGTELGKGESSEAFSIPAQGDAALTAKLDIRWNSLSLLAPYALAAKPLPYRLHGTARLGSEKLNMDVPFTIDGQLTPDQVIQAGLRGASTFLQKK